MYETSWGLVPNLLGTVTLAGLAAVLPLRAAEKAFITLIVVVFALGFARLVRGTRDHTPPLALIGPALAFNYPLHMGFYGFCFGMAIVPWAWAIAARRSRPGWRTVSLLSALGVLAWFAHLVAGLAVGLGIGALALTRAEPRARWRLATSLLPIAALTAIYAASFESGERSHWAVGKLLETLVTLRVLTGYIGAQEALAGALAAGLATLVALELRERIRGRATWRGAAPWLVAAVGGVVLLLALPDGSHGHWFLSERLTLLPWLALCPLAVHDRWPRLQTTAFACGALGLLAAALPHHELLSAELDAYVKVAERIAPGSTVLALDPSGADEGAARARPFLHVVGWAAATRGAVDAGNYEAQTDHFPVQLQPYVVMPDHNRVQSDPTLLDFARFRTRIDYIVVRHLAAGPELRRAVEQAGYSERHSEGSVTLFERLPE